MKTFIIKITSIKNSSSYYICNVDAEDKDQAIMMISDGTYDAIEDHSVEDITYSENDLIEILFEADIIDNEARCQVARGKFDEIYC